jgi:DNA ligase (NAD+)
MGCVLTGTLSRPRDEYAELIRLAGGNVQSSVTSKTRYLIAGANTGASKTSKAQKLGTEVIDEARLLELLGDAAKQNPDNRENAVENISANKVSEPKPVQGMLF